MKTVTLTINLYSFSELSKEAKEKVLTDFLDINTNFSWWEFIYSDAEKIGLSITSFDIDRNKIDGEFILSAAEVAANIFRDHGEETDTNKSAKFFIQRWQPVFDAYMQTEKGESTLMKLEASFLKDLLSDYLKMLQEEYEYQTTTEAIIETIESNDYLFFEDGEMANTITHTGNHPKAGQSEFEFHGKAYPLI